MKQKTCFVVCPIGEDGSETRRKADLLTEFVISAVLAAPPFSMKVSRADNLGQPGIITNQIIKELEDSDLVVADLSDGNPNVFYEIAIRHVTRKPFVHLITKGQRIPFDNAPVRAIDFDLADLRSVDSAKKELANQATHALQHGQSESPVSIAATLESLRETGNLDKIVLADVLTSLASLQGSVDRIAATQIAFEKRATISGGMFGGLPALQQTNALHPANALSGVFDAARTASTAPTFVTSEAAENARRELDETLKKLIG